jgi:hypothetical protein
MAKLAIDFVRDIDGVSVTLLGVRSVEQLRGLLDVTQDVGLSLLPG